MVPELVQCLYGLSQDILSRRTFWVCDCLDSRLIVRKDDAFPRNVCRYIGVEWFYCPSILPFLFLNLPVDFYHPISTTRPLSPRRTQHRSRSAERSRHFTFSHCSRPELNVLLDGTGLEASQPKMAKSRARDRLQGCDRSRNNLTTDTCRREDVDSSTLCILCANPSFQAVANHVET